MDSYPSKLFENMQMEDIKERNLRIARFMVLEEMGFFGVKTNIRLAQGDYAGTFSGATRRAFSNTYGDVGGCHPADLEVAAEMLGVFDIIYDYDADVSANDPA